MAFGERLQELRRARGMTQEDFAAQLREVVDTKAKR